MRVGEEEVYAFIFDQIDTVPHLEALLQVWKSRPKIWTESEMAARLFLEVDTARSILADLVRRGLVALHDDPPKSYSYLSSESNDPLVCGVAQAYQHDLIRVSTAIHSKASSGVREFARAFYFTRKGKKP